MVSVMETPSIYKCEIQINRKGNNPTRPWPRLRYIVDMDTLLTCHAINMTCGRLKLTFQVAKR